MRTFQMTYFESQLDRTFYINKALREGEYPKSRPLCFHGEAEFPFVPRAGDAVFFFLNKEYARYFPKSSVDLDTGKVRVSGIVRGVELTSGCPDIHVHVSPEGCGRRGELSAEQKAQHEAIVGGPINWK